LYNKGFGNEWLERSIIAVEAELEFQSDWKQQISAQIINHEFHWEMKNLALLKIQQLVGARLPTDLQSNLKNALMDWHNLNIDSANWTAMRALAYHLRNQQFGRKNDQLRSSLELSLLLTMQTNDGFFPDTPISYSMQYHAYVLSLLAIYLRSDKDLCVRNSFLKGVRFIADFVDPDGDFNYYGRGQRQIKGYVCLILALSEAAQLCTDQEEKIRYYNLRQRIYRFISRFRHARNFFPLVLNLSSKKYGWYSYNRLGDYLSLCGVWLFLASEIEDPLTIKPYQNKSYSYFYPELGLAVINRPCWFASFASGGVDLAEPAGLIHLWPKGPTTLGGPQPPKAMEIDYSDNYIGPLADGKALLQYKRGRMQFDNKSISLCFSLQDLDIEQIFWLDKGLEFEQTLFPKRKPISINPIKIVGFRPFNCNIDIESIGSCTSPTGKIEGFLSGNIELFRPLTIRFSFIPNESHQLEVEEYISPLTKISFVYSFYRLILKVIWVLWVKVLK
jgi:hypothetical protein